MRFHIIPPLLLALAACDSPSISMMGGTKTEVTIDGSRFSVHRHEDRVEVIRTNMQWRPTADQIVPKAEMAIRQATGCAVRGNSLEGDAAIIKARLNCSGNLPPVERIGPQTYSCDIIEDWVSESRNIRTTEVFCTAD